VSKTITAALAGIARGATFYAKPWRRAHLRLLVSERLYQRDTIETKYGPIVFVTTHARALGGPFHFWTDEPETLAWIDNMPADAVLWDIGANLGQYTMYAARRGLTVLAFEPAPNTYAALCRNLAENGLELGAYCVALGERTCLGTLHMTHTHTGSVYNAFEQDVDSAGRTMNVEYRQAAVGVSADDLVDLFRVPLPTHIKLDVDSTEAAILRGASNLLASPRTKSVLVEHTLHPSAQNVAIDEIMTRAGFKPIGGGPAGFETVNVIYERM
jgi:FkbM family methyltransferase